MPAVLLRTDVMTFPDDGWLPSTVVPENVTGVCFVHVVGTSVWVADAPADDAWRRHVVGVLDGIAWHAVDVPADVDPLQPEARLLHHLIDP